MLKNNKGVTIVSLVITVIVLFILLAVTVNLGASLIKDAKIKKYVTTMYLVKAKITNIYESYEFSGDSALLLQNSSVKKYDNLTSLVSAIGMSTNEQNKLAISGAWYEWGKNTAELHGIKTDMLNNGAYFLVNYETGEVVYNKGVTDYDGNTIYSLTGMEEI